MINFNWKSSLGILFLFVSISLSAQKQPIREFYAYSGVNDSEMIKAKTDLFLLDVLSSGKFEIDTNSQGEDHLDVTVKTPYERGEITSRVRYDFLKEGYVVSLSNTSIKSVGKKPIRIDETSSESHQKLLEQFKKLFFETYQKEISKEV